MATTSDGHLKFIEEIAQEDASGLIKAHRSYGDSWKKRGGIGAYLIMIRKFDRMERAAEKVDYDIVQAVRDDPRTEGVIDDIRDARRYLMLIESWLRELGLVKSGDHRDNVPEPRSYSDLDNPKAHLAAGGIESAEMAEVIAARRIELAKAADEIVAERAKEKAELNSSNDHQAGEACDCGQCLSRKAVAQEPHIADCECDSCKRIATERARRHHHRIICSGKDCGDSAHNGDLHLKSSAAHDPHNKGER